MIGNDAGGNTAITLVGHPFSPSGRGEDVRSAYRALQEVGIAARLLDLHGQVSPDRQARHEFGDALATQPSGLNLYFINGDEVEGALARLGGLPAHARNILYPAWELPTYPEKWHPWLALFDEIWAPSRFIARSLANFHARPVHLRSLPCQVRLTRLYDRRHFGIPDGAYCFLFFFDFKSFVCRKNPFAAIDAFCNVLQARPTADTRLIIKAHGASEDADSEQVKQIRQLANIQPRVMLIEGTMSDEETKNLVRLADCFVSLHRAEGFGRGMAEAMSLAKPVIATAYSGNMDFMNPENAFCVDYALTAVREGEYPEWEGQSWADPDVDQAAQHMASLVDDPALGRSMGRAARRDALLSLGYLASGLRYRDALAAP